MTDRPSDPPLASVSGPSRSIHDSLFKRVFSDPAVAAGELQAVLPPDVVACIDWPRLTPAPSNYVDSVLRQRLGDLVFHADLHDGGEMLLWFLLEHQSTEDWRMPLRIVRTKTTMWDQWPAPKGVLLPGILPVVVYHGQKPWQAPTAMEELLALSEPVRAALGEHLLRCRFVLDDLSAVTDEDIRARKMSALGKLALLSMAHGAAEDFLQRLAARWEAELNQVMRGPREQWEGLMLYISNMSPRPKEDTMQHLLALQARISKSAAEFMGGTVHRFVQESYDEGLDKGRREGVDEGREAERRELLMLMLEQRFGPLPEATKARVAAAGGDELRRWTMRILSASSLDDVLAE